MPNMPMRWSTDDVTPRQSLAYWNHLLTDKVLRLDVSSRKRSHFDGRIIGAELGRSRVYFIAAQNDQCADHSRACVAQREDDSLCLVHMRSGAFHFESRERSADLVIGDCVLLDSKQIFRFTLPEWSSSLVLRFTSEWMRRWIPQFEDLAGMRIDGGHGWGQTLSHALWNIDPIYVADLPLPGTTVADQIGGLLTLAVAPSSTLPSRNQALLKRVQAVIRESCIEADLDPDAVAGMVGISKRYLHKLLASAGTTFRRELYERRLAEAERLLLQPRSSRPSLADIALACGYCDASHFARHFRARYGKSPGACRSAVSGKSRDEACE